MKNRIYLPCIILTIVTSGLVDCFQGASNKQYQEYEALSSSQSGYLVAWTNHYIENCDPPKDMDHPGDCDHKLQALAVRIDSNGTILDPKGISIGAPEVQRVAGYYPMIYSFLIPGRDGYFLQHGANGYWISSQGVVEPASESMSQIMSQATFDGAVIALADNKYMSIVCNVMYGYFTPKGIKTQRFSADGVWIDEQLIALQTDNEYHCESTPMAAYNEQLQALLVVWKDGDLYKAIRLAADGSKLDSNPFDLHSYNSQTPVLAERPEYVASRNGGWGVIVMDNPNYYLVTVNGDGSIDKTSIVGSIEMTPGSWATSNASLFHSWVVNDITGHDNQFPFSYLGQRFNLDNAQPIDAAPLSIGQGHYGTDAASDGRSFISVYITEDDRIAAAHIREDGKLTLRDELAPIP